MESTHGPGQGQGHGSVSWDPSGFGPSEPWGQQYGTPFDQDVGASGDYPSPEFTNNGALNSHMTGAVNHGDGLQNAYGFYRQGDVWPGHPQATTASFSQGSPSSHEYQRDRQHFSGGNQTVAGRFAVDLPQGNGFPNHFTQDMSQTSDGYHHQRLAQWQEPADYGLNQMFDNPLHANTVSGDASSTFYPNHGPAESVTARFEPDGHQQMPVSSRSIHPQFAHQTGQQLALETFRFPAAQPAAGRQPIFDHQPQPSSGHPPARPVEGPGNVSPKQSPASQIQVAPAAVELTRVPTPAPAPPALPALTAAPAPAPADIQQAVAAQAQPQSPAEPICSINFVDDELLASSTQPGTTWPGVAHLVIGTAPVKLRNGPPTKRYVTLATKGGANPLFPEASRGWMPAEILGNHFKAYETYKDPVDIAGRQSADIRLKLDLKRLNMEIPGDWYKKGLKDRLNRVPNTPIEPKEPMLTAFEAIELLRIHPAHLSNPTMVGDVVSNFSTFIQTKASSLYRLLGSENPSVTATQVQLAKTQLESAIEQGLRAEPSHLIERMSGSQRMIAGLMNTLVRLLNTGERPSSLVHAILRFYIRLTGVTPAQWEKFKLGKVKRALEKQKDEVGLSLISQVGGIGDESPEASDSEGNNPSARPGAGRKKAAHTSAQTVPPSKQTTVGSDRKKAAASSTTKSTTPTSDLKNSSAAVTSSKKMASGGEANKPVSKATEKMPSNAIGVKRSRDEDQGGADARSAKKMNNPASVIKPLATSASKTASTTPTTKPATAASSTSVSTTQPKPRTGLLLPGKARPTVKPAPKPQPTKPEAASKSNTAKPSAAAAVPPATTPKPGDAATPSESTNSTFSTLMKEIQQEKTIRAPESHRKKAPTVDPNETPEERERRLRKESRRHLRVAFKTGDEMVQVREFTREPEEIAEANMARSALIDGRDKNAEEAQTMKRHHKGGNIIATDINDREWEELTPIDFTTIDESLRTHTFDTRGGLKTFESEERRRMKERESIELVAVYSRRTDIPPTPRSPPYEPSLPAERLERKEWNLSSMPAIHDEAKLRAWEYKTKGPKFAAEAVLKRLEDQQRVHDEWRAANPDTVRTRDSFKAPVVRVQWPPSDTIAEDPRTWFHPSAAAERDRKTLMALSTAKTRFFRDCDKYDETLPRRKTEEELDNDPKLQNVLKNLSIMAGPINANKVQSEAEEKKIGEAKVAAASNPLQQEVPQPHHQPTVTASQTTEQQSAAPDYTAAWAQYYASQQQQQKQQQQGWYAQQAANAYVPPQVPQAPTHQPATDSNNQVASILAALGAQQQTAQPPAQNQSSGYPAPDQNQLNTVLMALGLHGQNQAQASAPATQTQPYQQYYGQAAAQNYGQGYGNLYGNSNNDSSQDRDRERARERDNSGWDRNDRDRGERNDRDRDHHYRGGNTGNSGRGRNGGNSANSGGGRGNDNVPDHLRGINRNLIGTKACAFWAKGQCAKGDKCTFRHD
ncbi:hypothetical protein B0J18DRAFT_158104 [Chaetomium sp. MPI-SDFR-AT-0129]|nr:hypothetical protein B0J18DRAFT_158104 [Chaetomium sp. MPI-SDFR-AT-0129]